MIVSLLMFDSKMETFDIKLLDAIVTIQYSFIHKLPKYSPKDFSILLMSIYESMSICDMLSHGGMKLRAFTGMCHVAALVTYWLLLLMDKTSD